MDLMQNLEGPMGFFKANLKSCNRGPQFSYDEAVDVYSREPYCYNPALFTAGGIEELFDQDIDEDDDDEDEDGGWYDDNGRYNCNRPVCVLCH